MVTNSNVTGTNLFLFLFSIGRNGSIEVNDGKKKENRGKINEIELNRTGDWLARGYMPAHQHCDLLPTCWGSVWDCRKLGNALVLWSRTGFWVRSG